MAAMDDLDFTNVAFQDWDGSTVMLSVIKIVLKKLRFVNAFFRDETY